MAQEQVLPRSFNVVSQAHEHLASLNTNNVNNIQKLRQSSNNNNNCNYNRTGNNQTSLSKDTQNPPTSADSSQQQQQQLQQHKVTSKSVIAILRRHVMYDSLILVKRWKSSQGSFSLEFPTTQLNKHDPKDCARTQLVSIYLDGDDPMYQSRENSDLLAAEGEIVHVPMNGLLTRLDSYERQGVTIDSRVYAYALGLKTAGKFICTSNVKEIQETPPLGCS